MEERIARLEANVEHIQSDVTEIKGDIRRLDAKIDGVEQRLSAKIDGVKDSLTSAKIWALGLYIALAAGLLLVLARGFKWL